MYQISTLKNRLMDAKSIQSLAKISGVSEKTIHRIKTGASDTTLGTANKILAAMDELYPVKQPRKPRATQGVANV
jgi:predicted transcriptional regulator